MILNRNLIFDLTIGDKLRVPQSGDSDVVIPPSLNLVALTARPHALTTVLPTAAMDDSFQTETFVARVNQISLLTQIIILQPGLWELALYLACYFDYNPVTPLTFSSAVRIEVQSIFGSSMIMARMPAIGSFTDRHQLRYLFTQQTTISLRVPATGLTDDLAAAIAVNAVRVL